MKWGKKINKYINTIAAHNITIPIFNEINRH